MNSSLEYGVKEKTEVRYDILNTLNSRSNSIGSKEENLEKAV
jgi:hypothetical protein